MSRNNLQIERMIPRFLLQDKNGYALAKAIERIFLDVYDAAVRGLQIIKDPDKMPEWRLDEMAGELGCLYDYNGTEEQKRYWIKNANELYKLYGTPQAIYTFLEGYFQDVKVEEAWEYGGEPYHFRVIISGESYDANKIAWAKKAISSVKNVRSILDNVTIDAKGDVNITADTDHFFVMYPYAAEDEQTAANDLYEAGIEQTP